MTDINYHGQHRHREERTLTLKLVGLCCKHRKSFGCPPKGLVTARKIVSLLSRSRCCILRLHAETFNFNINRIGGERGVGGENAG